ncbi:MAG: FkbM family methyltransferase [Candidatus Pacebacteria bacterium]|nr:FkbM family methyltransferase [Candidatus Paceibacterota bacterium]
MATLRNTILAALPSSWRRHAVELKNMFWGGWRHHYYSHCGEDVVIDAYFRGKPTGFYVDVGAHHPRRYSNTALLYERGWRGINIDADRQAMNLFRSRRPDDINLCSGVAEHEGTLELHRFSDPAVNTFSSENAARLRKKAWLDEVAVEQVPVRPLASILATHLPPGTAIDFLNVDVEDLDLEVLRSHDWVAHRPRLVAVEDRFYDPRAPQESTTYTYLKDRNYIFLAYIGLTLLFVDEGALPSRPQ